MRRAANCALAGAKYLLISAPGPSDRTVNQQRGIHHEKQSLVNRDPYRGRKPPPSLEKHRANSLVLHSPSSTFLVDKKGVYFSAAWIVFLTLAAIFCETAPAYDGWGKSIPNITDPGMPARYLWRDAVEDGNKESLLYGYDGDHLAAIVANLNYAAMRNSYATGDFDGNGCQDLAVGTPYATVAGVTAAGRVRVLFYQPVAPASTRWHHRAWAAANLQVVA